MLSSMFVSRALSHVLNPPPHCASDDIDWDSARVARSVTLVSSLSLAFWGMAVWGVLSFFR